MKFLTDNSTEARLLRTILQGILGVIIANLDVFVNVLVINPAYKPVIVALVMAILSPIMSEIGKHKDGGDDDFEDIEL